MRADQPAPNPRRAFRSRPLSARSGDGQLDTTSCRLSDEQPVHHRHEHRRVFRAWPGRPIRSARPSLEVPGHDFLNRAQSCRRRLVARVDALDKVTVSPTLTATLAGSKDRQLEELMQTCGLRVAVSKVEELATLAQPGAAQPSLVILDMRDRPVLPPTVAMLRRQHPATGVVLVAATLEPALMLEAMRAGVTEFLTAPVTAPELTAAVGRVTTAHAPEHDGRGLRVHRRQRRRRHDHCGDQRRDGAVPERPRFHAVHRPAPCLRRRRRLSRRGASVLRHRRARERASAGQGLSHRARRPRPRRAVAPRVVRSRERDAD